MPLSPTAVKLSAAVPDTPRAASFFDDGFAAPPFANFLPAAFSSAVGGGANSIQTAKNSNCGQLRKKHTRRTIIHHSPFVQTPKEAHTRV